MMNTKGCVQARMSVCMCVEADTDAECLLESIPTLYFESLNDVGAHSFSQAGG